MSDLQVEKHGGGTGRTVGLVECDVVDEADSLVARP